MGNETRATTREKLAAQIHYPACWDTAAYPTLEDALYEIIDGKKCIECYPVAWPFEYPDDEQRDCRGMTTEPTLLPCPFCGSANPELGCVEDEKSCENGGYFIQCTNAGCGASVGLIFACADDPRPRLAERWNRRVL